MKSTFIKLTQAKKEPIYINPTHIILFNKSVEYPDLSFICMSHNSYKKGLYVIETVEQIRKLIEEAS